MANKINSIYSVCTSVRCTEGSQHTVDYCMVVPDKAKRLLDGLKSNPCFDECIELKEIYFDLISKCHYADFDLDAFLYKYRKSLNIKIGIIAGLQFQLELYMLNESK